MSTYETTTERTEWGSSVSIEETAKGPRVACKIRVPDDEDAVQKAAEIACKTYDGVITWLVSRGLRSSAAGLS